MADDPDTAASPTPAPRRRSRWLVASALVATLVVVAIAALVAWLSTPSALRYALDRAVAASEGKLAIEGLEGTLLGPFSAKSVTWRDGDTSIIAHDVRIDALLAPLASGRLVVRELRARRIDVALGAGDGSPVTMPESLALPIDIEIARVVVDTIEIRRGEETTTLSQATFAFTSDSRAHQVRGLRVSAEGATLTGTATVGTVKPFATRGAASLVLVKPRREGRIDAKFEGDLAALEITLRSDIADIVADGRARVAPFAAQPFLEGRGQARDIDLSRFDASWPVTRLAVIFEALPAADGFTGRLDVENAAAGAVDANRLPLTSVRARYTLTGRKLELAALDARLAGSGALSGSGTLDLDTLKSRWKLAVQNVDLKRVHGALVATSLSGSLDADVAGDVQRIVGDVSQKDLRLAFDARYDGEKLVVERASARSAGGSLEGSGRFDVAGAKPFRVEARASRFDPSRFGDFPRGAIDATLAVTGTFEPAVRAEANVVVLRGSRFAGLPASARVHGRFTPTTVSALDADVTLGANRVRASGAYGRPGDRLAATVAAKRLAELAPLLPDAVPKPLTGALDAEGVLELRERGARIAVQGKGSALAVGSDWRAGTLAVDASGVHDAALAQPSLAALRDVSVSINVSDASTPQGPIDRARVTLAGSAAQHVVTIDARSGERTIDTALAGALDTTGADLRWRGRIDRLATRGVPFIEQAKLATPTTLSLAKDEVVLGAFRLESTVATVESDGFAYRNGALDSRGRFTGLALATIQKQAAPELRLPTDLVLGGRWDIASTPAWRGTLSVQRERGDVYVDDSFDESARKVALGIETLALDVAVDGRRATGKARLDAKLCGDALVDFEVVAPAGAAHPFDARSALRASVRANVPSLAVLQPWIGTIARVQGQATADLKVAGTIAEPVVTGQLAASELRYAMPQYGVNLTDGRLRIASGREGLLLEELQFRSGDGTFSASGVIGLPREGGGLGASRVQWKAENFRVMNRPETRLVVDGQGTLAVEDKRIVLRGRVSADEGYVEYRPRDDTRLADDIVVVGRPRPGSRTGDVAGVAALPLDLDLEVELGRDFRFVGEGFESRLAGRLRVTSQGGGPILAKGTIRALRGTYTAFGQRLDIERGRLLFDGPIADPSLDIVALRKNQAVEAGIEITGNLRTPLVRLTSNPPVPDSEKLAWLLTGGPAGSQSARESAAISAATAALMSRGGGKPINRQLAERVGLDDISIASRYGGTSADAVGTQVVSLGKRVSDRLYVAFEQGLSVATNALRIDYVLSRFFTVSAFVGTSNGISLSFRRNWR